MDSLKIFLIIALSLTFTEVSYSQNNSETNLVSENYVPGIQEELARLGMESTGLESDLYCIIISKNQTPLKNPLHIEINKKAKTIFIYFENVLTIPSTNNLKLLFFKKLLEVNSRLVNSKLELLPQTDNIRYSTTLNIDSNFDRKAFRSVLLGLFSTLPEIQKELSKEKN